MLAAVGQRHHMIEREIVQRDDVAAERTVPAPLGIYGALQDVRQFDGTHGAAHATPARATIQSEGAPAHDIHHPVVERRRPCQIHRRLIRENWLWLARCGAGRRTRGGSGATTWMG